MPVQTVRFLLRVEYKNGVYLGEILPDVDGFYYFWPDLKGGSWDESVLRQIADRLAELNKAWQEQIASDPRIQGGDSGSSPVSAAQSHDITTTTKRK